MPDRPIRVVPTPATEPVMLSAAVTAAVAAVLAALVALDVLTLTAEQSGAIIGAVTALVALAGAVWARARVTPTADPRDDNGAPLEPVGARPEGRHYRDA